MDEVDIVNPGNEAGASSTSSTLSTQSMLSGSIAYTFSGTMNGSR